MGTIWDSFGSDADLRLNIGFQGSRAPGLQGSRVPGFRVGFQGSGFRGVQGPGWFRVQVLVSGFRVQGSGFRVQRFQGVQGSGFRV